MLKKGFTQERKLQEMFSLSEFGWWVERQYTMQDGKMVPVLGYNDGRIVYPGTLYVMPGQGIPDTCARGMHASKLAWDAITHANPDTMNIWLVSVGGRIDQNMNRDKIAAEYRYHIGCVSADEVQRAVFNHVVAVMRQRHPKLRRKIDDALAGGLGSRRKVRNAGGKLLQLVKHGTHLYEAIRRVRSESNVISRARSAISFVSSGEQIDNKLMLERIFSPLKQRILEGGN